MFIECLHYIIVRLIPYFSPERVNMYTWFFVSHWDNVKGVEWLIL